MLGLKKLKERWEEKKRKKTLLQRAVLTIANWFFCVFCFTCLLAYGLDFGAVLIVLIGIVALPIKTIKDVWNNFLKFKQKNIVKGCIIFVAFILAIGFLPSAETNTISSDMIQDVKDSEMFGAESFDESESEEKREIVASKEEEVVSETTEIVVNENKVADGSEIELMPVQLSVEPTITANSLPAYSGNAYVVLNDNIPYFSTSELSPVSCEFYSDLDSLGRCGVVYACVGQDLMPTEERGPMGHVRPSGWHTVKYNGYIDGNYLYNRCHLIGYQLCGENANTKNLITGTRQLNMEGMLPFENMVADYVKETANHVMYRVTPVFDGDNLLATGIQMEAYSIEDAGEGICFNVFVYNVQDGIEINYVDGESRLTEVVEKESEATVDQSPEPESTPEKEQLHEQEVLAAGGNYAVNNKNGKIHIVGECTATGTGSQAMKEPVYFATYEEALAYSEQIAPNLDKRNCGNCW